MERLKSTWKILLLIACIISTVNAQETPDLDVPYVPTSQEVVNAMLDLAGVTARDVVYDLGCGDGRIVITAAKKYGATRSEEHTSELQSLMRISYSVFCLKK